MRRIRWPVRDWGRQEGFTLLEVLVALAVLAIALGALIKGGMENATNAAYLRDKTLADWVAMNRIAEVRLADKWPETGTTHGTEEMARREWRWTVKVSTTFDRDVRRLDVEVTDAQAQDEAALVHRIGFVGRPAAKQPTTTRPSAKQGQSS